MRTLSLVALALAAFVQATAADAKVVIAIDKSTQRMTVSVDGTTRWTWPVSTGRRGHATPAGSFQAFRMEEDHFSKEWDDAPMPHSIFFTKKGHAIHGSLETRRLGTPASAGCVRLHPANAKQLFALVKERGVLNATVVVSGEEPRGSVPAVATRKSPSPTRRSAYDDEIEFADPRAVQPGYRQPAYPQGYDPAPPPGYRYGPQPLPQGDYYR